MFAGGSRAVGMVVLKAVKPISQSVARHHQQGAAALETIFLMPAILLMLYTIAHYSLIFVAMQMFTYTAEEALRESIRFVDESCYYGGGCDSQALQDEVKSNAQAIIDGMTPGGKLFGQSLTQVWTSAETSQSGKAFEILVADVGEGECCQVVIRYEYARFPFLPAIFHLPVPDQLTGSARLQL